MKKEEYMVTKAQEYFIKCATITASDTMFKGGSFTLVTGESPDELYERDPEEYHKQKQEMINGSRLAPKKGT